jgi:hypothetical protein
MIEEGHDASYDVMHPPSVAPGTELNAREKPSRYRSRCEPERVQLLSELDTPLMRWTPGRRVGTGVVGASIVHGV